MSNYFKQFSLTQVLSVPFTFLVYTYFFSWKAALVLIIGVGFHELSHLWAARHLGLKTGGFVFLPFIGGMAYLNESPRSRGEQAFVAIMGPAGGALLAAVTLGAYYLTGSVLLGSAALWMVYINLFNLLPLSILDGGQLLDTVSYSVGRTFGLVLKTISTVIALLLLGKLNYVIGIFVGLTATPVLFQEMKDWNNLRKGKRFLVSERYLNPMKTQNLKGVFLTMVCWIVLAGLLLVMSFALKDVSISNLLK